MIFNTHYPYIGGSGGGGGGVPQFEYTGTYEYIDDGGGNWRIKFLTSGTFTPLKAMTIDVFLVGGGASGSRSGGGGGYTKTVKSINLTARTPYEIIIGAGGVGRKSSSSTSDGNDGGTTSAFNYNAEGGKGGIYSTASGAGDTNGSCGGSGGGETSGGNGGSDGGNGAYWGNSTGGRGQGTTTREFGESTGDLYSGGGGGSKSSREYGHGGAGGGADAKQSAANNTGGGGGGNWNGQPGSGGSGIAIIRKAR